MKQTSLVGTPFIAYAYEAAADQQSRSQVVPSNYTLSILCKLLGRGRRLEQAFEIVKTFTEEYGFKANIQATQIPKRHSMAQLKLESEIY